MNMDSYSYSCDCIFFFFFQAEDGIRDYKVTGVQTCALPICRCGTEIVNLDDPAGRRLIRPTTVTYSAAGDPEADWRAVEITGGGDAPRFVAVGPDGIGVAAAVALPRRHNVAHALLALAPPGGARGGPGGAPRRVARRSGVTG